MTRHTLHVPTLLNNGVPVGDESLGWIEQRLLEIGGGFTMTEGIGAWRDPDEGTTYREPVRLYAVDTEDDVREQLRNLADAITYALEQAAVYLTEQEIVPTLVYA